VWRLRLGEVEHDLAARTLVMGVLNRTTDSFFDAGRYFAMDAFLERAARLVDEGADILDVGGVKAGPGPEVGEEEELERVVPAVEALRARFDVPLSVDTWRASVLDASCRAGAQVGNDISGFADPAYLPVAAAAGATVVATHIRLAPRVADPDPQYGDLVGDVRAFLVERVDRAQQAGVADDRIVVDAGLDLGKTPAQSLELLQRSDALSDLGVPLLLSASNKRFLGEILDLPIDGRTMASHAAHALGIARGCRILRVHDVKGARRVADVLAAILAAKVPAHG
jgi:dihydropteroate synthase